MGSLVTSGAARTENPNPNVTSSVVPSIVVPFHRLYHWLLGHFPPEEVGVPSN